MLVEVLQKLVIVAILRPLGYPRPHKPFTGFLLMLVRHIEELGTVKLDLKVGDD